MIEQTHTLRNKNLLKKKFVTAGELVISKKDEIIWTILGSCITVIFHVKNIKLTLFSHSQLPTQGLRTDACTIDCPKPCYKIAPETNEFKYVSCTIMYMIQKIEDLQIKKSDIKAYLLGGASKFNITLNGGKSIGDRNIETAQEILKSLKITINQHIGGKTSRKISFNTATGTIKVSQS